MAANTLKAERRDDDAAKIGRAVQVIRERLGLTQAQAAEAFETDMTSQYWGMHETGKVRGIFKPARQRQLLDALSTAAKLDEPLTLDDLQDALEDGQAPAAAHDRMARIARELGGGERRAALAANETEAVFPLPEGPVVIRYPADLTPEGFKALGEFVAMIVRTHGG